MVPRLCPRLRDALVPFHWPGRDARLLQSLPPGELRRYNLLWLGRGRSRLRVAVLVAVVAGTVVVANRQPHPLMWVVGGNVVALTPAFLIVNHVESRIRARMIDQEYPHLCRTCGYDLSATPDRCPECGSTPRDRDSQKADGGSTGRDTSPV
jgi:hypothetical protein